MTENQASEPRPNLSVEDEAIEFIRDTFGSGVASKAGISPEEALTTLVREKRRASVVREVTPLSAVILETARLTLGVRGRIPSTIFVDSEGTFSMPELVLEIKTGTAKIVIVLDVLSDTDFDNVASLLAEARDVAQSSRAAMLDYLEAAKNSGAPFPARVLNAWVDMTGRLESVKTSSSVSARFYDDLKVQISRLHAATAKIKLIVWGK